MRQTLRMNQGDPSEGRIYFLPHFVARDRGHFAAHDLDVEFVWAEPGDHLAKSGQIPAVLNGAADLTVGGPMVTMRMRADGSAHLVNFCALVRKNPWWLAARTPTPGFTLTDLVGKTVFDAASITTASLSLKHALQRAGIADDVTVIALEREDEHAIDDFVAGRGPGGGADVIFHSMHALAPALSDGRLAPLADLARDTGDVPWSAYITTAQTYAANAGKFAAFSAGIVDALRWVAANDAETIAAEVAGYYPGHSRAALVYGIDAYKRLGVWADERAIAEPDFERFRTLLMETGWFDTEVAYADLVRTSPATAN